MIEKIEWTERNDSTIWLGYGYYDTEKDKKYYFRLCVQGYEVYVDTDVEGFSMPRPVDEQSPDIQRIATAFQDMIIKVIHTMTDKIQVSKIFFEQMIKDFRFLTTIVFSDPTCVGNRLLYAISRIEELLKEKEQ